MSRSETSSEVLSRFVYDELRARIIDGRLAAGEPLRERDLAEELNVSRVPIREALPALEHAGFVRVVPRRSAVVTHITVTDVDELYDLRAVLEPLAAKGAAAAVAAGASPAPLETAVEASRGALETQDYAAFSRHNTEFHRGIEALAGNALYVTTMEPLHERSDRLNVATLRSEPSARHAEHVQLCAAIAAGRAEVAAALAFTHVELGRHRTLETLAHVPGFVP